MKKILLIMVVVLAFALSSSMAFAAVISGSTKIGGEIDFSTSTNVTISIASQDQAYTAHSKHYNGDRAFCGCGGSDVTGGGCEGVKRSKDPLDTGTTVSESDVGDPTATAGCPSPTWQ